MTKGRPQKYLAGDRVLDAFTVLERSGNRAVLRCDSGHVREASVNNISARKVRCQECPKPDRKNKAGVKLGRPAKYGSVGARAVYAIYRNQAKTRGYSFNLDQKTVDAVTQRNCSYCGAPPSNKQKTYYGEIHIYSGIDRVDNEIGYEPDNVVPCCSTCNLAKRAMSKKDFVAWINRVYYHLNI